MSERPRARRDKDRGPGDRALALATWLDDRYLDPLLGVLLPGAGDLLCSGLGLYAVAAAVRARLPLVVVARMLLNLAVDAALGAVPVVGDLFDVAFKAHKRNLRLLQQRHPSRRARPSDWLVVGGAALLFLLALLAPVIAVIALIRLLF